MLWKRNSHQTNPAPAIMFSEDRLQCVKPWQVPEYSMLIHWHEMDNPLLYWEHVTLVGDRRYLREYIRGVCGDWL